MGNHLSCRADELDIRIFQNVKRDEKTIKSNEEKYL